MVSLIANTAFAFLLPVNYLFAGSGTQGYTSAPTYYPPVQRIYVNPPQQRNVNPAKEPKNYGDTPRCSNAKLSLVKRLSQNDLWFTLDQAKVKGEYNPYPGSYWYSIRFLPYRNEPNFNTFTDSQRSKAMAYMKTMNMENTAKEIIKNCKNISVVSFPIPNSGSRLEFYRHERGRVKPFECLGYSAPSGWGFGPCT